MKALIAVLLVVCVAAEQKREAEPSYRHGVGFPLPYGVVGGHHYGVGYGHAAIAHHPYGGHSYVQSYSHNLHKREADPGYTHPAYGYGYGRGIGYGIGHSYGYGPAVAHHPYGGQSYVQSYSHNLHKREADPGYTHPAYGYGYGRGIGYGIGHTYGYGPAVAHHPYGGHSYVQSYSHNLHKREADPGYTHPAYGYGYGRGIGYGIGHSYGYGPAVAHHPYGGQSYVQSYSHNLHKREADPGYTRPAYGYGYGR